MIEKTKRFWVFSLPHDISRDSTVTNNVPERFVRALNSLHHQGYCILRNSMPENCFISTISSLRPLIAHAIHCYDNHEDEFVGVDTDRFNIVRFPRIGHGKHNCHFDSHCSEQHEALANLAAAAGIETLLTAYHDKAAHLRETGISLTSPNGGDGMEWHSDGGAGENTCLMTLSDLLPEQGVLRISPKSHTRYKDGVGHENIDVTTASLGSLDHCYQAGEPIIIDGESPNTPLLSSHHDA